MSIKTELLALQKAAVDGMLHAAKVVGWARKNKNSAIHAALEWDNKIAAEEYRIWQVRRLIQIHVVYEDRTPQMVSLTIDRGEIDGGYRHINDVLKSQNLSAIMLSDALAELERIQLKYAHVKELTSIWAEVKKVRERTKKKVT